MKRSFAVRAAITWMSLATLSACSRIDEWWAALQGMGASTDAATEEAQHASTPDHDQHNDEPTEQRELPTPTVEPSPPDASETSNSATEVDAATIDTDAGVAPNDGPSIIATWLWVPIFERMDWNGPKVGYFRAGAALRLRIPTSVGTGGGCPRGWYEVEGGGYVCLNRMTTLDPHELDGRRPLQPDTSQPMPYPYMTTYRPAVMYRWLPSEADMREVEPERFHGAGSSASRDAGATVPIARSAGALLSTGIDAGAVQATSALVANRAQAQDAGIRIEDLQGPDGSPLLRRLLAGMYISVDREITSAGRRFVRTQSGGYIERSATSPVHNAPTFQGIVIDEAHPLPAAFMVAFEGYTYDLSEDRRRAVRRERAPRLSVYYLTEDPPVTIGRENYLKTRDGFYVRERNVRQVRTSAPPPDVAANEKWIEVNLDRQMLIAYEGARPVYATLISSGRRNPESDERNYETIQGAFRIYSKHLTATMDGNSAGDGPYSIEDVPWVMYFEGSFALHGAFWHNLFGFMRSHGCVNMAPADARWVFLWSEPQLPPGWHGIYSNTTNRLGTRVYVHYERQALGERGGPRVIPQH